MLYVAQFHYTLIKYVIRSNTISFFGRKEIAKLKGELEKGAGTYSHYRAIKKIC